MIKANTLLALVLLFASSIAFANSDIRIPAYKHVDNPSCSCSCDNKIIYRHEKITYNSLTNWAKEATSSSLSFGFGNYESALEKASQYYTHQGWNDFTLALKQSGNLDIIVEDKLIVKAIPSGQPSVVKEKKQDGRRAWEVELPILMKYENAEKTLRESLHVKMTIMQTAPGSDTQNLGITQIVIERNKASS